MNEQSFSAGRLLALYERVADAPDAIARLRRFVLDLAVRGKLAPQDPADEPASVLLKRIAAEKARLVKAGEIKEPKPISFLYDVAAEISSNWAIVPLGEVILQHLGGGTPSKSNASYWNGELRWASVKDVGKSKYLDDTIDRITEAGLANSSSNLIKPGKLLVVMRMGLGKISINCIPVAINQDLRALFLSQHVSIDYAYNFFLTHGFEGTGLTVKGIKLDQLLCIPFPLPPLAEQRRIVAKVDELMALLDRLEAARRQREAARDRLTAASLTRLAAPADLETARAHARFALAALPALTTRPDQIRTLRQTILNLAVRGKLVEQDPGDEPAAALLKRIATDRGESSKRRKDIPDFDREALGELPPNWAAAALIALGDWAIGSGFPKNEQGLPDGPYFFLKVSDMNLPKNSKFIVTANNFIDDAAAKRMRAAIHTPGTIIFPKIGGAIATNKRRILTRGSAIDNNCLGITFARHIDLEWAYLLMTTLDFTLYQAGTAVPALQQGTLAAIPVALPPLAEQHRIVAKVDALMALCDRLEAALADADVARQRLLEALLHEALNPVSEPSRKAAE